WRLIFTQLVRLQECQLESDPGVEVMSTRSKHSAGCLPMTKSLPTLIAVMAASLVGLNPIAAQQIPGGEKAGSVRIIIGPGPESVGEKSAIVTWTSTTPRGPA